MIKYSEFYVVLLQERESVYFIFPKNLCALTACSAKIVPDMLCLLRFLPFTLCSSPWEKE